MRQLGPAQVALDRSDLEQLLRNLADEVLAIPWPPSARDGETPWLVALSQGGLAVANELADVLRIDQGQRPQVGALHVSRPPELEAAYRGLDNAVATDLGDDITGRQILLVDDVLRSGWTAQAALTSLLAHGRPAAVRLAVLLATNDRAIPLDAAAVGYRLDAGYSPQVTLRLDASGRLQDVLAQGAPVPAGAPPLPAPGSSESSTGQ